MDGIVGTRPLKAMYVLRVAAPLALVALCLICVVKSCGPDQTQYGCKIFNYACTCGHGCKTEYVYLSRRSCMNSLRERSTNACYRVPCLRGICIQTSQDPGYTCKCEGTGFYGQRCEKACPTMPMRGLVFPHECVVI